jgi:hypothetical protein
MMYKERIENDQSDHIATEQEDNIMTSTNTEVTVKSLQDLDAIIAMAQVDDAPEQEEEIEQNEETLSLMEELEDVGESDEALDLLQELDLEGDISDDPFEVDPSAELDEDALRDLDAAISRKEVYESQASVALTTVDKVDVKAGAKAPRTPRTPRAAAAPRVERDLASLDPATFVLNGDVASMSEADILTAKAETLDRMPAQVKVAEKFENLFQAVASGKSPSRYTTIAFDLLNKNTTITSSDLVASLCANGCGDGTARSQAGQMMVLFNATRIADRVGQTLTLRTDSLLAERLRVIAGA